MEAGSPSFAGAYMAFRFAYVGLGLLGAWALWRRPRPGAAVVLVVLLNLAAWAAYVAPLGRPYAFGEPSDRSISMGNAATVATGNSPACMRTCRAKTISATFATASVTR